MDENIIGKMEKNDKIFSGSIIVNNNPDKLDDATLDKVNELREKRNAYNKQAEEVQKEIDQIILEANNFAQLTGKYLSINYGDPDTIILCGPIIKVDRIYSRSCRITAKKSIKTYFGEGSRTINKVIVDNNDPEFDISHYDSEAFGKRKTKYQEISEDEFNDSFNEIINDIIK